MDILGCNLCAALDVATVVVIILFGIAGLIGLICLLDSVTGG